MAKIPDTGPIPMRITKNIAQIKEGRLLRDANRSLAKVDTAKGLMFRAANKARGHENVIPNTVETKAI